MSEIPDWIDPLAELVAGFLTSTSQLGPLGIRFREEEPGTWEVVIYPTPVELIGGAADGATFAPAFTVDVEGLRKEFEPVRKCGVSSHGIYEDESGYFWIEGKWNNLPMTLRILLAPPENEAPGSKLDMNRREEDDGGA